MSENGHREPEPTGETLLAVEQLVVTYRGRHRGRGGSDRRIVAVDGIDLDVCSGESLGVVGESGSGKSTLARAIVGLVRPASGHIRYHDTDLATATEAQLRSVRRDIQMVFQDPYGSVNPRFNVRDVIAEPLDNYHRDWSRSLRNDYITELLLRVRLPADLADRSVVGLSGGQLQRVGIARALALGPRLLVADEPVSALDVSIQARILNLLAELKTSEHISLLFITHNLAVARFIADRIAVVYAGRVMEVGRASDVIRSPEHPYSSELLAALPGVRTRVAAGEEAAADSVVVGEVGCPYRIRCPHAVEICTAVTPRLEEKVSGRLVACHLVASASRTAAENGDRTTVDVMVSGSPPVAGGSPPDAS